MSLYTTLVTIFFTHSTCSYSICSQVLNNTFSSSNTSILSYSICSQCRAPSRNITTSTARVARQPHATAHTHRARDRAVVPRAREAPVKALAAIRRCRCPLAYEGPERRGRHNRRVLARAVDVLLERQRVVLGGRISCDDLRNAKWADTHGVGEHLVDVRIEHDALVLRRLQEAVPVVDAHEPVMHFHDQVRLAFIPGEAHVVVTVSIELLCHDQRLGVVPCGVQWPARVASVLARSALGAAKG